MKLRRFAGAAIMATGLAACGVLTPLPKPMSLDERLAMFPTENLPIKKEVAVYWNDHHVPFIDAQDDGDLAFTLGLVHAHLRLGIMEIFRLASQGRLAEVGGPLAVDIDHALRIVDFGKAAPDIVAAMPADTRQWLEEFVRGINYYVANAKELPHEFAVLGLKQEPWTAEDVVTAGRLASADVNWFVWFSLLGQRSRADWPALWARLVEEGSESFPSYLAGETGSRAHLMDILAGFSRSGSNSVAVGANRSASGGAMLASDPHLGIFQPSLWVLAGYRSPSYHAAGLMGPGLPFIALGRNLSIAWGGTNLRAASSDLFDVSALPPSAFREREERIKVRWWFDKTVTVRESDFGPILSDAAALDTGPSEPLAMRWVGHRPTDELTAMLRVNQASDWPAFRGALAEFAVSSQNMLYADSSGNIGHLMATRLPARGLELPRDIVLQPTEGAHWQRLIGGADLPITFNPPGGILASANNRGAVADIPIGYFFSPDDRVVRLTGILEANGPIAVADLAKLQQDTYQGSSVALRNVLLEEIDRLGEGLALSANAARAVQALRDWDGHYRIDSGGALAFETFLFHVVDNLVDPVQQSAYNAAGRPFSFIEADIRSASEARLSVVLSGALEKAGAAIESGQTWGDVHRLQIAHPLGALPILGKRYVFDNLPVAGSSQTVMKTAHDMTDKKHNTQFGSNARHISDMSDPDENYFVLLGGQDGWMGSSTFMDQISLWRDGEFIRVPLRLETVRATFPHTLALRPGR
ncbi:MAG: penicillin acylase family protein [Alphaproteobacteria bacterium]